MRLTGLVLDDDAGVRRDPPPRSQVLSPAFWESYDSTTIAYLAQHDARRGQLLLTCPPLLNLAQLSWVARFYTADGPLPPPRHLKRKRHDLLVFPCRRHPEWVAVDGPNLSGRMTVLPDDTALFAGRNLLYTLSLDNDLDWISDWMIWHNRAQGTDALIFVDNGSTSYTLEQLTEAIARVPGYAAVRLVLAPFRYGATFKTESRMGAGHFLQVALLNAAFRQAGLAVRGFLNVDVDELVTTPSSTTVFDLVQRSRLGYVSLPGRWRHAQTEARPRHADHIWQRPGDAPCKTKYCLRPGLVSSRVTLKTHAVTWLPRLRWPAMMQPDFIHHSGITTEWSAHRSASREGRLDRDADLQTRFLRLFGS